jgi:hypothetical protein
MQNEQGRCGAGIEPCGSGETEEGINFIEKQILSANPEHYRDNLT